MSKLAELWAQEIKAERKTIDDVPAKLVDQVQQILDG